MSRRVFDVNYKDHESIPFWKSIVSEVIKKHFLDGGGIDSRITSIKISSVSQMAGRRMRIEILPERDFDKEVLSFKIIEALREQDLEVMAQKQKEEINEKILLALRNEKIMELVESHHNEVKDSIEQKFQDEKAEFKDRLEVMDKTLGKMLRDGLEKRFSDYDTKIMDYDVKISAYDEKITKDRKDISKLIDILNEKIKTLESLDERKPAVNSEGGKVFDGGVTMGLAIASMLTSLIILMIILLG